MVFLCAYARTISAVGRPVKLIVGLVANPVVLPGIVLAVPLVVLSVSSRPLDVAEKGA